MPWMARTCLPTIRAGTPGAGCCYSRFGMGWPCRSADLPGGEAGQGIVFTADGRHIIAQFNVEHELAAYAVNEGALQDTGVRIPVAGGPASIRSQPR